jgi:hypothetical protein
MNISYFLKDDSGNYSSKRLLALSWGFCILGVWGYVSIASKTMAPLAWEHVGIVLSLAGVVAAGKWGEK